MKSKMMCGVAAFAVGLAAMQAAAGDKFTADLRTATVVCADTNSVGSVTAAKELEKHLALVAGKRAPSPDGIVFAVGERPAGAPEPAVFESCGRVCGKRVSFWGEEAEHGLERSQGPLFAVYEFIEKKLGVKWVAPGDENIVYSPRSCIELSDGEAWSFTPPFEVCNFMHYRQCDFRKMLAGNAALPEVFRCKKLDMVRMSNTIAQWYNRMRIASTNRHKSGHAYSWWQGRYLKDHPEWFAYVTNPLVCRDGKPGRGVVDSQARYVHGCYTCPELPQVIIDDWIAKGTPKRFNFCLNDGAWFCECPKCLALDTRLPGEEFKDHLTDRVVYFYNKVMALAVKVRPDVDACAYIYSLYRKPPRREKLLYGDNMIFGWVPALGDDYLAQIKAWKDVGVKRFYARPNYLCYLGAFPRGLERFLYDNFKDCTSLPGAVGVLYDGRYNPIMGIDYYLLCSLAQRPGRGFDEIMEEFYSQYGAAAPEAKAYFEHVRARSGATLAFAKSAKMPELRQRVDDSELDKFAYAGHSLADLEAELAILRPGLEKPLDARDRVRFSRLVMRAEHAVLTFRFISAASGRDDAELQKTADALYAFRVANRDAFGRCEAYRWFARKNRAEYEAWHRTKYMPKPVVNAGGKGKGN